MNKSSVLVLCYHRVNILKIDTNLLAVSPENFRKHMKFLKDNYNIVKFEDDWNKLSGRAVVITFDDGYFDNYKNAFPILKELNIPATFFISTGNIEKGKEFWWDELENILLNGNYFPESFHLKDEIYECRWDTYNYEMRKNCYRSLHYLMKNFIDIKKREQWMTQLWNWKGEKPNTRSENLIINKSECKELERSDIISIGAHTMSHPSLKSLNVDQQREEIDGSIKYLSNVLNKEIDIFSYPFGIKDIDFSNDTIELCKKLNIKKAAAAYGGVWNNTMDDYTIPRNGIRNMDLNEFENKIEGLWKNYE